MTSHPRFAAIPLALLAVLAGCRGNSPAARMRAIAARGGRTVEARLTGFAWSRMRVQRGAAQLDPARLELAGAAGAVIESSPNGRDAGIGYLIIDRDADAVEALQEAAQQSPNDPKVWSDLAAARYTLAVRGEKPYELPRALAAADHALRLDANLPDALFNRALIIEHLGITDAARRAWHRYLQTDGTSKWADEALAHLGRISVVTPGAEFRRDLARATAAMASGDAAPLAALARTYPEEARRWGEGPLLGEWAAAAQKNDAATATQKLDVVRAIGRALATSSQERLLDDAVAWIDGNPARAAAIAEAQATYGEGRIALSKHQNVESQRLLARAAELFKASGSPMALTARYYLANTFYEDNRLGEASSMLRQLLSEIDAGRYRGLSAHINWTLALCQVAAGEWERAIHSMDSASRTFGSLGETNNRAETEWLLADLLDRVAQPRAAWAARVHAFPDLSRGESRRIRTALAKAIKPAAERRQFDVAIALSKIVIEELQNEPSPVIRSDAWIDCTRLFAEAGDENAAREASASARDAVARIADDPIRARFSVLLQVAESVALRRTNPKAAVASIDQALQFLTSRDEHAALPDVYLQRGRAHVRMSDDTAALADFDAGIHELDVLRSQFGQGQFRSDFYDTKSDLITDTVALLLRRGDAARAFAVADAMRARSLTEQLGPLDQPLTLETLGKHLGPGTAMIEYALLDDAVAIFYASRNSNGVELVPAETGTLQTSIGRLDDAIQRRGTLATVQSDAAVLHRLLVKPLASRLRGIDRLVIVPDRELHALPFAALYDSEAHRYLVETFTIAIAPSARYLLRSQAALSLSPALVVGDPKSDSGPALPDAAREAEVIASMYPATTFLNGDRATRARFIESAERSGMIHYAGHAQSDTVGSYGRIRLAADDARRPGDLDAEDIARLHLRGSPLVVLAACGTIRGDSGHVEGMPSVARAFLAAGAHGVIGTLWEIDDNTAAPLFRSVHQQLRRGIAPTLALRNAQLTLLQSADPQLQHPASWAPIEILGRED